ncbi:MAG: hypothetical protein HQL45_14250 [Alphaproteobacteria bacterium]|nr:hypothetical protein [Alphaproteobacteria bacterium]
MKKLKPYQKAFLRQKNKKNARSKKTKKCAVAMPPNWHRLDRRSISLIELFEFGIEP